MKSTFSPVRLNIFQTNQSESSAPVANKSRHGANKRHNNQYRVPHSYDRRAEWYIVARNARFKCVNSKTRVRILCWRLSVNPLMFRRRRVKQVGSLPLKPTRQRGENGGRRNWPALRGQTGGKETITRRAAALVSPNASLSEHSNILRSPQVEGSIRLRAHWFNYVGHKIIEKWVL